jgi:hypothetical protein
MRQKNSVEVSGVTSGVAILRNVCLVAIIVSLTVPGATSIVQAQTRYIASPTNWFVSTTGVQDKVFPDYVVEFEIPTNATNIFVYTSTAGIESRVLAFSTVYPSYAMRNGKKVVRVVTGYRARKCSSSYNPAAWTCNYTGSIGQWASSLRVRYYR